MGISFYEHTQFLNKKSGIRSLGILGTSIALIVLLFTAPVNSQTTFDTKRPKLAVGIVIDQMRAEYLYRFSKNYGEDGFKKLLNSGFNVKNVHYNYLPTATGPGHASIFTGTTPSNHGIVANNWYDRKTDQIVNCVSDVDAISIPAIKKDESQMSVGSSPKNLECTTITDELKLFFNQRSKVFGVSLKNRGAILPTGHLANQAFWYDISSGEFITSSFYNRPVPKWLKKFNNLKRADSILNLTWSPILEDSKYRGSTLDDSPLEKIHKGREKSTFPYNLRDLRKLNGDYDLLPRTPYGNSLVTKMALACLDGEKLGIGDETDFLTVSYSSTDYVGHQFGIRSKELEDTYIRMDREIAELLHGLDETVGQNNYTLFLTADHAAGDHPKYSELMKLPGREFSSNTIKSDLESQLKAKFGEKKYISHMDMSQIYLTNVSQGDPAIIDYILKYVRALDGVQSAYHKNKLDGLVFVQGEIASLLSKSIHAKNSGDIFIIYKPGWMEKRNYGTTHGTRYNYDTHVPLIFYGKNIPKGQTIKKHTITQIAPTLAFLLDIPLPNSSSKQPIVEIFTQENLEN